MRVLPKLFGVGATVSVTSLSLLSMSAPAVAGDLFVVTAQSATNSVTVSGSRLPTLLDDIGDVAGQFAVLSGQAFTGSITYAGVANAVAVAYDPNGGGAGIATLQITNLLGTDASAIPLFTEANGDLGTQLEDYFLKQAPSVISSFQKAIAGSTPVSPVSGNPASAVGTTLRYREHRFGIYKIKFGGAASAVPTGGGGLAPVMDASVSSGDGAAVPAMPSADATGSAEGGVPVAPATQGFKWGAMVTGSGGAVSAGGFSGNYATVEPSVSLDFNETVSLVLGAPMSYTSWAGTNSGSLGLQLDMPITLVSQESVNWTVTPGGGAVGAFSYDLAEGGLLWNAGVISMVEVANEDWSLGVSQQYEHFSSVSLHYQGYTVDYGASQDVLSFGGRVARRLGDGLLAYVGTTWSTTLDGDAYVSSWFEPMAGVAWQFEDGGSLNLGFEGGFGDNGWQTWGGQVSLRFPF